MNDLDKTIAAAREALAAADESLKSNAGPKAMLDDHYDACAGCADALRDVIAALDAARSQVIGYMWPGAMQELESMKGYTEALIFRKPTGQAGTPLYAAPPAAAVPNSTDFAGPGFTGRLSYSQTEQAPPAAVVPPGYALVPVEPTEEMSFEGDQILQDEMCNATQVWAAMLAASKEKLND